MEAETLPKGYKQSDAVTVLDEVRASPGIIQRDVARRTGLGERLVRGHLHQLILERRVRVVRTGAGKAMYHALPSASEETARSTR